MDFELPQLTVQYLAFGASFVLIYWILGERWRSPALSAVSVAFLAVLDPVSLGLAALATLGTWEAMQGRGARASLAALLALIALITAVKGAVATGVSQNLVVPIGFGFYTLKLIHYVVECRRGTFASHSFADLVRYMAFFPTLLVGPIHRFEDFQRNERRRRWDPELFAGGLQELLYGYAKVVILANWLVAIALRRLCTAHTVTGTAPSILGETLVYGFYLYFAFAGYSSLAVGWSRLLGYEIGPNFRFPFLQPSIGAFWKCWHMTLSDWCRRYVFLPVLARWRVPALASVLAMLAIGLWHEFTPRYVAWGLYHGIGIAAWRWYEAQLKPRLPTSGAPWARATWRGIATLITFVFVMLSFVITKNTHLGDAAHEFGTILTRWMHD